MVLKNATANKYNYNLDDQPSVKTASSPPINYIAAHDGNAFGNADTDDLPPLQQMSKEQLI